MMYLHGFCLRYYSFWVQGAGTTRLYLNTSSTIDMDLVDSDQFAPIAESPMATMKYHIHPSQQSTPQFLEASDPTSRKN